MGTTTVIIQNNLDTALPILTTASPGLDSAYWGVYASTAAPVQQENAYWISRSSGITDGKTWVFSTTLVVGGTPVSLQVQLTGTFLDSNMMLRVTAGSGDSGWWAQPRVVLNFTAADGRSYAVSGASVSPGVAEHDNVVFSVAAVVLPQIKHMVVLMMENRSLDNLLGWIYDDANPPAHVLPSGSAPAYNGLATGTFSNSANDVNGGQPVNATRGTTSWTVNGQTLSEFNVPNPDPGEAFADVAEQVSGGMGGFLSNYLKEIQAAGGPVDSTRQIMGSYSPEQVPVISALAKQYAVSDQWYSSVPSQTWPNRYFLLAGTCFGNVNNKVTGTTDGSTIFDVLSSVNIPWTVYSDNEVSLVKVMFWRYWDNLSNFAGIDAFTAACGAGTLPAFSFLEPSFGLDFDDYNVNLGVDASYHPPHDVRPAEKLLADIHAAIQGSPHPEEILLVVLFDEHGGTYDHVPPPSGARPPMPVPRAIDGTGFTFDRFGVRVPAIVVSPYVRPGTVFRTPTNVPYDHTSVLATVRDWLGLQVAFRNMLPSPRIAAAPTLAPVLGAELTDPERPMPEPLPWQAPVVVPETTALNPLQRTIAVAAALKAAGRAPTPEHFADAGGMLQTVADLEKITTFADRPDGASE